MVFSLLWALVGCRPSPEDSDSGPVDSDSATDSATDTATDTGTNSELVVQLLPDGRPNLLLPSQVAVDSLHRRAWINSLVASVIAEVNLDSGALTGSYTYSDALTPQPTLETDGDGYLWISGGSQSPILRFDPANHQSTVVNVPGNGLNELIGRSVGGVYGIEQDLNEQMQLVEVNADLSFSLKPLPGFATAIAWVSEPDVLAVSLAVAPNQYAVQLYEPVSMTLVGSCNSPSPALDLAPLPGNKIAAVFTDGAGVLDCSGGEPISVQQGVEPMELLPVSEGFVVMDRIGDETAAGPNWGIGRHYRPDMTLAGSYPTGKNTGFGGVDTVRGLAWANSEGTTEILGFNPEDGTMAHRVQVGVHFEDQAWSPLFPEDLWFSGRLSRTLARIRTSDGTVEMLPDFEGWPVSPVFRQRELWFLDQLTQELWKLDPSTFQLVDHFDLGLPDNALLTFDSLLYDPQRDQFYLADAGENQLLVIGPDGVERSRWPLPGDQISDPDQTGSLQMVLAANGILVLRTADGMFSRVSPDHGVENSRQLPEDVIRSFQDMAVPRPMFVPSDEKCVYVGPRPYNSRTLSGCGLPSMPVQQLVGEVDGQYIGWGKGTVSLIAADGTLVEQQELDAAALMNPVPLYLPTEKRLNYWNADRAEVHSLSFP